MDMYKSQAEQRQNCSNEAMKTAEDRDLNRLKAASVLLTSWYDASHRTLPWRENPTAYSIWISEIMLQQTRIEAVKPYYDRFMKELPHVTALASVEDDRLMKLWEGLGYYNRARNLKKAAQIMVCEYEGDLPPKYKELLKLPGIGSYTAGAIASIAFGEAVPAVDGNVLRVLSRIFASREDISRQQVKKHWEEMLLKILPKTSPSSLNQGIMELGETICLPNGRPACESCPVKKLCLAFRDHLTEELPIKSPPQKRRIEERTVCILEYQDEVGLCKRPDTGLLASLYELPNIENHLTREQIFAEFGLKKEEIVQMEDLPEAKHIFSHVEWRMIGYRIVLGRPLGKRWISAKKEELKTIYPLPNAFSRYTKLIK